MIARPNIGFDWLSFMELKQLRGFKCTYTRRMWLREPIKSEPQIIKSNLKHINKSIVAKLAWEKDET